MNATTNVWETIAIHTQHCVIHLWKQCDNQYCACFFAINPDLCLQEAVQDLKKKVTQMTEKMKSLEETLESSLEENKVCL